MLSFKNWLEEAGEDAGRGNKGPFARVRPKLVADDEEVPRHLRSKSGELAPAASPEAVFGRPKTKVKMKKQMKKR